MPVYSGQDAKLQIGKETTWGTAVAPTKQIDITKEDLKLAVKYIEEDTLVGARTTPRMDVAGKKIEGGFEMIVKPDNIGLLLKAALGAEAAPSAVAGKSTMYSHVFSLVAGGGSSSLPKLTVVVDRKVAVFGAVSWKVDTLRLDAKVQDYLRAAFSGRGQNEQTDTTESLTGSTLRAFQFIDGNATVDGAEWAEIASFTLTHNNNLEDDLFTMDGSTTMQEIEPQKREITLEMEVLYSSTTNTARSSKFVGGATCSVVMDFTSTDTQEGVNYRLRFTLPKCYIIAADPLVSGPERIRMTLSLKATEQGGSEPMTVLLINADTAAY